jgi:hypothetical protein
LVALAEVSVTIEQGVAGQQLGQVVPCGGVGVVASRWREWYNLRGVFPRNLLESSTTTSKPFESVDKS